MKKIHILFSCILIAGTAQLSAMKRGQNQIADTAPESQITTTMPETQQELWLPDDLIMKIAAICKPEARTNWSLVNTYFNKWASIKNNPMIIDQPEFEIEKENRLYYLFYGCLHNLKNLVKNTLQKFDSGSYIDHRILNYTKHFIEKLTDNDSVELLPYHPDISINQENALHWAVNEGLNPSLIKLLLQQPASDVNAQNDLKDTPLHIAIRDHHVQAVKLLLAHPDIKLNIPNDDKHVVFDLARFTQRKLADKYSDLANQERIFGLSWIQKMTEHVNKIQKNAAIIGLLMHADGWDV